MVAFASGGRRRSEIAGLRREQLTAEPTHKMPDGPPVPSLAIHLGRTKIAISEQDETVYLTRRPVEALNAWMVAARIESAAYFGASTNGEISRLARSIRKRSTRSSKTKRRWPAWRRPTIRPTVSDPGISPKQPIAAFRCLKQWINRAIVLSNRHRATTTAPPGEAEERRAYYKNASFLRPVRRD
jgi:hypothetical protein